MAMAITVPHYTVDDLDDFPDDGNRYELLDGVLLVTPAPNMRGTRSSRGRIQVTTRAGGPADRVGVCSRPGRGRPPSEYPTSTRPPRFSDRPTSRTLTGARSKRIGSRSKC